MKPAAKKVSLAVLFCLAVVVIVAAILLHPYYAMPPESKEALEAKLAEYQKVGSAMQDRPKAGRQALDALIKDSKPIDTKKPEQPWVESCPAYSLDHFKKLEPQMSAFLAFDSRFRALVDHGLVIQQDFSFESDLLHFSGLRWLTYWENGAAVLDLQQGRRNEAMQRFHTVLRLTASLFQTPTLIYCMIGVALEMNVDKALIHLLPQLNPAEMEQLKGWLAELPDSNKAIVTAMEVETASFVGAIDREGNPEPGDTSGDPLSIIRTLPGGAFGDFFFHHKTLSRVVVWLARNTGYLRRERSMFVSLASREIEAAQTWSASGVNDAYHSPLTGKEIMHSMCFAIAWPNYTALLGKTTDNMRRRQALIKAMELELQRRAKRQQTFELPYDAEHHIVVKPEYGCIVKNEGGQ